MKNLKIDEDFKNLLPDLTSEEYTGLEKDIVKHGVLNPIIVWNGTIVDGHNRYAICQAHHIENFQTKEVSFNSKAEAMQWIVDHQFAKRNLELSQKISLQAKVHAELEKEAKENHAENMRRNQKQSQSLVNLPPIEKVNVAEQMAAKVGVSEKTYRDAK